MTSPKIVSDAEKLRTVQETLLSYLGSKPEGLKSGKLTAGELALTLGNALAWIAHYLDEPKPPGVPFNPLPREFETVRALANALQVQGRQRLHYRAKTAVEVMDAICAAHSKGKAN